MRHIATHFPAISPPDNKRRLLHATCADGMGRFALLYKNLCTWTRFDCAAGDSQVLAARPTLWVAVRLSQTVSR
jgi:hypothetical protein